jgi:hypothetical protein
MEQGQTDRSQAAATAEACLVLRAKLQIDGRLRDLAMFNLAIDSKLRGCDVVALRLEDVAPSGYALDRATRPTKKDRPTGAVRAQ